MNQIGPSRAGRLRSPREAARSSGARRSARTRERRRERRRTRAAPHRAVRARQWPRERQSATPSQSARATLGERPRSTPSAYTVYPRSSIRSLSRRTRSGISASPRKPTAAQLPNRTMSATAMLHAAAATARRGEPDRERPEEELRGDADSKTRAGCRGEIAKTPDKRRGEAQQDRDVARRDRVGDWRPEEAQPVTAPVANAERPRESDEDTNEQELEDALREPNRQERERHGRDADQRRIDVVDDQIVGTAHDESAADRSSRRHESPRPRSSSWSGSPWPPCRRT